MRLGRCNALLPKGPCLLRTAPSLRAAYVSRQISDLRTGHIEVKESQGIIFVDNIFPHRLQWLLRGLFRGIQSYDEALKRIDKPYIAASDAFGIIKHAIPSTVGVKIMDVIPRYHEGGAFVKYERSSTDISNADVEAAVKEHLAKNPIKPWFNPFQHVGVSRVLGRPWIEDLYHIPSQRLRVEFHSTSPETSPVELNPEILYSLFRPYGKLTNIERQASDSKVLPRFAYVEFARSKYAVVAKNCLHGFILPEEEGGGKHGTRLKLKYERKIKLSMIKDWLLNHPRIVIPAFAALIAAVTVVIFDPIRTFSIQVKLKASSHTEDNSVLRWIRNQFSRANIKYFGHPVRSDTRRLMALSKDRQEDINQLQAWLTENVETFIVVYGPRGSGKRELVVDQALKDRKYQLVIDCKQIQDAKGDSAKIARAAAQVGYRPIFSWMNSMSSFIDLASQGMIGTKAGFSETLDAQLSKIWQNTGVALKYVALEDRTKNDKDNHLNDDEYLEAHPEQRPVVIIENFLHNAAESSVVYDKITEWAGGLTAANIAHVIFLTSDSSFSKPLSKALPNQVFRTIALGDCSLDVGRKFVLSHLEHETAEMGKAVPNGLEDLDRCIEMLGGRVTDLEFMAHRIKAGETPRRAVDRIIEQSSSEILKMFLLENPAHATTQPAWSREQVWHIIKALAESKTGVMPYNQILLSDLFKTNGEGILQSLEQAELLSIVSHNGCPQFVKPGKPILHVVFRRLTENKPLKIRLNLAIIAQLIGNQNKSVAKYEEELKLLGSLPKQPRELRDRIQWLLNKVHSAHAKIQRLEAESSELAKQLKTEH